MAFSVLRCFSGLPLLTLAFGCASQPPAPVASAPRAAAPPAVAAPPAASMPAPLPVASAKPALAHLRVGTSGDYAPFSTLDAAGKRQGFDVEIAEAMAHDLGFELEWLSFRWPTLQTQLQSDEFDVAMGGVTWQPARGVLGYLTRAVGRGGPCVLGDEQAAHVAVNRGGVLEAWARGHFAGRDLITVDSNQTLPDLLASGRAGAIVTDSFERKSFARPGWKVRCEPALARKVYWLGPNHAPLAARMDDWLRANTARVAIAQQRWFGEQQRLDALANLTDLLARRMAFMPFVAAAKAKINQPIEDLPREKIVLDAAAASAQKVGLPEGASRDFFALQIDLSKAVQRRSNEQATLDLTQQIRPALNELGDRILAAVAEARSAGTLSSCTLGDLELLSPWLKGDEMQRLLDALHALGR